MLSAQQFEIAPLPHIVFGVGSIDRLADHVRPLASNAVVITDAGVVGAGVAARVVEALEAGGIAVAMFGSIHANPVLEDITGGTAVLKAAFGDEPAVVIGLGGGSSMDAAKGIALLATNDVDVRMLDYNNPLPNPGLALIAVPTTAGTGAETNAFGVITDHDRNNKLYVGNNTVLPRVALLDPALTVGVPKIATANTGMDALTHAVEAMCGKGRNEYADGICLQVATMVQRWLPVAVDDGTDVEARSQLLFAAHLAGIAMATGTGQGACHGIGHALSTRLGVAHGAGLAVLLPHIMRFNLPVRLEALARLGLALGAGQVGATDEANAEAAIAAVAALSERVGTARRLADFGLTDELIPVIAQDCLDDVVTNNAPRYPTHAEVVELISAAR